ncbi:hypothetical protein HGRIS_005389 [Hohenbuehelia grisea]|uniref:Uncharacterized protein n=1 Tax=Hohenbuehelia grisea TaxID=104357 RepID=A0ABR3JFC1_9AGAR
MLLRFATPPDDFQSDTKPRLSSHPSNPATHVTLQQITCHGSPTYPNSRVSRGVCFSISDVLVLRAFDPSHVFGYALCGVFSSGGCISCFRSTRVFSSFVASVYCSSTILPFFMFRPHQSASSQHQRHLPLLLVHTPPLLVRLEAFRSASTSLARRDPATHDVFLPSRLRNP